MTEEADPSESVAERFAVFLSLHGRVQKVGFRKKLKAACEKARVTGWVRNMESGSVEAYLEGAAPAVRSVLADLHMGKISARVEEMTMNRAEPEGRAGFEILPTRPVLSRELEIAPAVLKKARFLSKANLEVNSYLMRISATGTGEEQEERHSELFDISLELPKKLLGEPLLQRQKRLPPNFIKSVTSFASEMWAHRLYSAESNKRIGASIEQILDSKSHARNLAERIGVPLPKIFQVAVPLADLDLKPGIVVKPFRASASRGVFVFKSESEILSLGNNKVLASIDEFLAEAGNVLEKMKRPDRWISEEFVSDASGGVPNDMKMLTFYGKVALVQEETRMPSRFCYYTRAGEKIRTGRYLDREFEGTGLDPRCVTFAEEISLKIPSAFCRIDFLKSANGPVFGEFTPKPGNFHQFSPDVDARLGAEFAKARARLDADLLSGKTFPEFSEVIEDYKRMKRSKSA